jgi:hypothetical protein
VHSRPYAQLEFPRILDDSLGAGDRTCRTVEAAEESVTRRVDLDASIDGKLPANSTPMLAEYIAPCSVSHTCDKERRSLSARSCSPAKTGGGIGRRPSE